MPNLEFVTCSIAEIDVFIRTYIRNKQLIELFLLPDFAGHVYADLIYPSKHVTSSTYLSLRSASNFAFA